MAKLSYLKIHHLPTNNVFVSRKVLTGSEASNLYYKTFKNLCTHSNHCNVEIKCSEDDLTIIPKSVMVDSVVAYIEVDSED